MPKKKTEEIPLENFKEGEYSSELKKELDELHKFKWSHVLWPLLSIIFISITLFFVYKNFIVKNTNSVIDRKAPEEKIISKPETKTEEVKKEEKPAEPVKEETKKVEPSTEDYTIKDGDTLGAVAEEKGIGLSELLAANPGLVAEDVQIGQVIKIPKK